MDMTLKNNTKDSTQDLASINVDNSIEYCVWQLIHCPVYNLIKDSVDYSIHCELWDITDNLIVDSIKDVINIELKFNIL
jgi:hypothetical protein